LKSKDGIEQFNFYRSLLVHLGNEGRGRVQEVFANSSTHLRQPKDLAKLVTDLDGLDWYDAKSDPDGLGKLYEGLLEKNAAEKKSGAGQYFTPRPLIQSIVELVKPQAGEVIQDPAAGTGGFLIAAHEYVRKHTDDLYELTEKQQNFQRKQAYVGLELVQETHRLLLMNAMLHGIESPITLGDTLGDAGANLPQAHVILTNPPFGTKKGGMPTRSDLTYPTSNKQLAFLQHIYRNLKPGGRAAVVLPDNVLFEDGTGVEVRRDLMNKCDLHTVLRLPTGIFYAQGVKTNVLFFRKGETKDTGNTKAVWVFDLRTNMPQFGKRTPLTPGTFKDFEHAFGTDPHGQSKRKDQGEEGRFRKFTRDAIAERGDNLDITWLRDENATNAADLPPPDEIAASITARLKTALQEMDKLTAVVGG
jgi:type I restriction enzyme M protein